MSQRMHSSDDEKSIVTCTRGPSDMLYSSSNVLDLQYSTNIEDTSRVSIASRDYANSL